MVKINGGPECYTFVAVSLAKAHAQWENISFCALLVFLFLILAGYICFINIRNVPPFRYISLGILLHHFCFLEQQRSSAWKWTCILIFFFKIRFHSQIKPVLMFYEDTAQVFENKTTPILVHNIVIGTWKKSAEMHFCHFSFTFKNNKTRWPVKSEPKEYERRTTSNWNTPRPFKCKAPLPLAAGTFVQRGSECVCTSTPGIFLVSDEARMKNERHLLRGHVK